VNAATIQLNPVAATVGGTLHLTKKSLPNALQLATMKVTNISAKLILSKQIYVMRNYLEHTLEVQYFGLRI
jgi:hypothetical protein